MNFGSKYESFNYTKYEKHKGHLDELQKAEIVSKSKLVHSVLIKTHY